MIRQLLTLVTGLFFCLAVQGQPGKPKGKLFIIGGGDRPPSLMHALVESANLSKEDYVVVLPMSGQDPDTSYYYFQADLAPFVKNPILNFNFTRDRVNDKNWLDSLQNAKLIFITGGDQDRFMKAVQHTPVIQSIHTAWHRGATIGGTSAGAAVMSKHMITGNQLRDTIYRSTFNSLVEKNIEFKNGLGLLTDAIIDQHFIVRSRYNRLISALAQYPDLACIGIDEETAIIIGDGVARVVGEGQVVVMREPAGIKVAGKGLIKFDDLRFSIYTAGDVFKINQRNTSK